MDKDYLIEKWLNNDLNESEKEAFKTLDDSQFHIEIVEAAKQFKASHFSEIDSYETFKKRFESQNKPVKKINWWSPLYKYASIIVIALGVYFGFFYNNLTHVETLVSEKTTIELPDASKVTLNALTTIEYHKRNWKENRTLKLNGEAYFKVAKGKKFDVITTDGIVTVVGTEFNVKQRENYFEVNCFEGKVNVSSDTISRQLVAGDTYRILNKKFTERKTTSKAPNWTNNMSDFYAIPFKEVLAEIERQYNVEITFKNINENRLFTGGFMHDDLKSALTSITQPMNMTYELSSSNLVVIHGEKN